MYCLIPLQKATYWLNNAKSARREPRSSKATSLLQTWGKGAKWTHLWAAEHEEMVREEVRRLGKSGAGVWATAIANLTRDMSEEERKSWGMRAKAVRDTIADSAQQMRYVVIE